MGRISKETAAVMFPAQVKVYRVMIEMFEVLKDMASEWDGKVINKRFITAFEKRFPKERGRLSISTSCRFLYFEIFILEDRWVSVGDISGNVSDYTRAVWYGNNPYISDDRRLDAEILKSLLNDHIQLLLQRIYNYNWCLEHYDEIKEQTRQLNVQIQAFYDRIPYPLKPSTRFINSPFDYS